MPVQVTAIMIGVDDLARSKKFYGELGCAIDRDHPHFVSFDLGDGSSSLALYEREAAARDAGVSSEGSGFRGVSFHFIVPSNSGPTTITHWNRQCPGLNVVGCIRSPGAGENALLAPGAIVTMSALWLK